MQHRWVGWSAVEWTGAQGIPCISNCPERTRRDAATRSARPPVLPPPPRPPQRRCRHLVSRAGTPRCACAGTASEGSRRRRAAILSVAGPADSTDPACFRPPPLPPVLPCCSMRVSGGHGRCAVCGVWAEEGTSSQPRSLPQFPPGEHSRRGWKTRAGGAPPGAGLRVRTGGRGAAWEPAGARQRRRLGGGVAVTPLWA